MVGSRYRISTSTASATMSAVERKMRVRRKRSGTKHSASPAGRRSTVPATMNAGVRSAGSGRAPGGNVMVAAGGVHRVSVASLAEWSASGISLPSRMLLLAEDVGAGGRTVVTVDMVRLPTALAVASGRPSSAMTLVGTDSALRTAPGLSDAAWPLQASRQARARAESRPACIWTSWLQNCEVLSPPAGSVSRETLV